MLKIFMLCLLLTVALAADKKKPDAKAPDAKAPDANGAKKSGDKVQGEAKKTEDAISKSAKGLNPSHGLSSIEKPVGKGFKEMETGAREEVQGMEDIGFGMFGEDER